jgi:hypothetical protein
MNTIECPEWLTRAGKKTVNEFQAIVECHNSLSNAIAGGRVLRKLPRKDVEALLQEAQASGGIKQTGKDWRVLNKEAMRRLWSDRRKATLWIVSRATPLWFFEEFLLTDAIAVVKLLDSFLAGLRGGDLLIPFICLRCVVEHTAQMHRLISWLQQQSVPSDWVAAHSLSGRIRDEISQKVFARRVDWLNLFQKKKSMADIEKGDLQYAPRTNQVDLTSQRVSKSIKELNKSLPGTEALYEFLCEFMHPNIGNYFSSLDATGDSVDLHGVRWLENHFGFGPPTAFFKTGGHLQGSVFEQASATLKHYERLRADANSEAEKILAIVQKSVMHFLEALPDCFEKYDPCPCGSGKKVKFCCGR